MGKLNMKLDTEKRVARETELCYIINPQSAEADFGTKDVVSGVDVTKSEEELVEAGMKVFRRHMGCDLSEEQRVALEGTLRKHQDCWKKPRVARFKYPASFKVIGKPVKDRLRPLTEPLRRELDKHIDSMLTSGVIRPSKSPWGSCPVFAKKGDGTWRLAVDYTRVNREIETDAYPIPNLWDNLQDVAGYKYYTKLDCNWGFWNVPLAEDSKPITALLTCRGTFEYNVLPFGIKNSPAEFQRAMDSFLGTLG
eukprot:GHVO01045847.1.p1 GENE.GHVO01045847.1~~GHVO01045847.1.p1  ORF type:complete len:252 (-),score=22.01 GHVO01045847.1:446-1201(-)